eukprot:gene926-biopygen15236
MLRNAVYGPAPRDGQGGASAGTWKVRETCETKVRGMTLAAPPLLSAGRGQRRSWLCSNATDPTSPTWLHLGVNSLFVGEGGVYILPPPTTFARPERVRGGSGRGTVLAYATRGRYSKVGEGPFTSFTPTAR